MSSSPSRNLAVNETMNLQDDERQPENLPTPTPSSTRLPSPSHPPQTPHHKPSPSSSSSSTSPSPSPSPSSSPSPSPSLSLFPIHPHTPPHQRLPTPTPSPSHPSSSSNSSPRVICYVCGGLVSIGQPSQDPGMEAICGHLFHLSCLEKTNKCPICRRVLPPPGY